MDVQQAGMSSTMLDWFHGFCKQDASDTTRRNVCTSIIFFVFIFTARFSSTQAFFDSLRPRYEPQGLTLTPFLTLFSIRSPCFFGEVSASQNRSRDPSLQKRAAHRHQAASDQTFSSCQFLCVHMFNSHIDKDGMGKIRLCAK